MMNSSWNGYSMWETIFPELTAIDMCCMLSELQIQKDCPTLPERAIRKICGHAHGPSNLNLVYGIEISHTGSYVQYGGNYAFSYGNMLYFVR